MKGCTFPKAQLSRDVSKAKQQKATTILAQEPSQYVGDRLRAGRILGPKSNVRFKLIELKSGRSAYDPFADIRSFGQNTRMSNDSIQAADAYRSFMTALMGLQDDAALEGYSKAGCELLQKAIKVFGAECDERYSITRD